MSKLKDAEETGSPQWRTFGYLGICRDMQNPVTCSDGFYEVSDRDLAIRAVNSYDTHRALIAELVEALEEIIRRENKAWMPMVAFRSESRVELDDAKHEAWTEAADIARAALTRAKEALK